MIKNSNKRKNAIKAGYRSGLEEDIGNQTEDLKFKFKLKASGKNKDGSTFTQKPMLFDAEGKQVSVEIWNNSIIKVAFEIIPFYTSLIGLGVSLRLKAVQIIELVEGKSGGSGSNAFGFKKEEGYVAPQESRVEFEFFDNSKEADDNPF